MFYLKNVFIVTAQANIIPSFMKWNNHSFHKQQQHFLNQTETNEKKTFMNKNWINLGANTNAKSMSPTLWKHNYSKYVAPMY